MRRPSKLVLFLEEQAPPKSSQKTAPPATTLYFDTTYLYRVYSTEPGHEVVKQLLLKTERVATAWHGRAEFASIVLRKRREGMDSSELLESLEIQFQCDITRNECRRMIRVLICE